MHRHAVATAIADLVTNSIDLHEDEDGVLTDRALSYLAEHGFTSENSEAAVSRWIESYINAAAALADIESFTPVESFEDHDEPDPCVDD